MNYKMSLLAIFVSYLIGLNTWADCCFTQPATNLPPPTYPCITTANFDACDNTPNRVGYLNNNARCSNDGFTCCVRGESGLIIEGRRKLVEVLAPPDCEPNDKAQRLPVIVDSFIAILESNGEVSLDGLVTNIGERAHLNIWRTQIDDESLTKLKKINKMPIQIQGNPNESIDFFEVDDNPLSGVNYYVLADRTMSGELTVYCDDIQYVTVGEGTPNPELAKELCEGAALLASIHMFEP